MLSQSAPSSLMQLDIQRSIISRNSWLKHEHSSHYGQGVPIHPILVPEIVSEPSMSVQPGYQEAHKIDDEMQLFLAQKSMSAHGGEVVIVKVTMVSLKPSNKSHSVISVDETNVSQPLWISDNFEFTEHIRNNL